MRFKHTLTLALVLLCSTLISLAQQIDKVDKRSKKPKSSISDTAKKVSKIDTLIIPLKIYSKFNYQFADSLMFKWNYNFDNLEATINPIDTTIMNSSYNLPGRANFSSYYDLGNMGSPIEDVFFFNRNSNYIYVLAPYSNQIKSAENTVFYNTKKPYSEFGYSTKGNRRYKGQTVTIKHTQNITPYLNFGVDYDVISSIGYYDNQKTKSERLGTNVSYVKNNYRAHFTYNTNKLTNQENGGIIADRFITDTIVDRTENIPVNLTNALSTVKYSDLVMSHNYLLSRSKETINDTLYKVEKEPLFDFGYTFGYKKSGRAYSDKYVKDENFYTTHYLDTLATADSIGVASLYHRLKVQIYGDSFGIPMRGSLVVGYNSDKYYSFTPESYFSGNNSFVDNGLFLNGIVNFPYKQFLASFSGKIYSGGLNSGDTYWNGSILWKFNLLNIDWNTKVNADINSHGSSFYHNQYFSNHIKWNNSFNKQTTLGLSGSVKSDKLKLQLSGFYNQINDFLYFDKNGPQQSASSLGIIGFRIKKGFALSFLRADILADIQKSSDETVLALPLFSTTSRLYLETRINFETTKGVMDLQFGVETMYNTKYYAPAYDPAMGVFHNQTEKQLGGYPWVDVFLNAKVKRTVIYMKYSHFNSSFSSKNYFSTLHYPTPAATFTYGFIWRFYN